MKIEEEDPGTHDVHALLLEHLSQMRCHSPPGSVHALDLDSLRAPAITFWTAREQAVLLGCGALMQLDKESAELKSMKTADAHLRKGVGKNLLAHIVCVAKGRRLRSLFLETGSPDAFIPARTLYTQFGFIACEPFGQYTHDPYSVFMRYELNEKP